MALCCGLRPQAKALGALSSINIQFGFGQARRDADFLDNVVQLALALRVSRLGSTDRHDDLRAGEIADQRADAGHQEGDGAKQQRLRRAVFRAAGGIAITAASPATSRIITMINKTELRLLAAISSYIPVAAMHAWGQD